MAMQPDAGKHDIVHWHRFKNKDGDHKMKTNIKQLLAAKDIHPDEKSLQKLQEKWQETLELKGDLSGIALDDADISLINIAGGDHHE